MQREFEQGVAVYNPAYNKAATIASESEVTSLATGRRSREHTLSPLDGDIFLSQGNPRE